MDQNLKHRLTGAIILVSLAVIFIPVILEGPDNEWTPLSQGIPEPPQLDYKARMELPDTPEIPALVKRNQKVVEKPVYKLAEPVRKQTVVSIPVAAPKSADMQMPEQLTGWYVQLASFSQELNASGLGKRLKSSGYDAGFQKTNTSAGVIYRVMVGPSTSRGQAEKLRDRLASEFKLTGIVVSDPG